MGGGVRGTLGQGCVVSAQQVLTQVLAASDHLSAASWQPFQMSWAPAQLNSSPLQATARHWAASGPLLQDPSPPMPQPRSTRKLELSVL